MHMKFQNDLKALCEAFEWRFDLHFGARNGARIDVQMQAGAKTIFATPPTQNAIFALQKRSQNA